MSRVILWLKRTQLHQLLTVFLAGILLLVSPAFGTSAPVSSPSDPLTPEAASYKAEGEMDRSTNAAAVQPRTDAENAKAEAQKTAETFAQDSKQAARKAQENT